MDTNYDIMMTLFGLLIIVLLVSGLVYMIIRIIRGKKYIYKQSVNLKLLEEAKEGDKRYKFTKKIFKELIFPSLWIIGFSTMLLLTADLSQALFGILLLTWFMFFRIFFILRSRKDKVMIQGDEVEFHFRKDAFKVNLNDYSEINLEFRKISGYNGSYVTPLLIFSSNTLQEASLSNAAFAATPYEVTEAIMILNPHLKAKKTWNDTVRKRTEFLPLRTAR